LHLRAILSLPIFEITLESGSECCNFSFGKFNNQPIRNRKYCFLTKKRISESLANQLQDQKNGCVLVNDTLETPIEEG
jgi:hypothetical protein